MNDLDAIPVEELIDLYEEVRDHRTAERARLHSRLAWRIHREAPSRTIGVSNGRVTYALDCNDELCRHIVTKRRFTKTNPSEKLSRVYRISL